MVLKSSSVSSAAVKNQKFLIRLLKVVGLRAAFTGLSLITGILLARILGPSEYGIYVYTVALASFVAMPASLGLDRLLIRDVAIYTAQSRWNYLKGLLQWANKWVLLSSVGWVGLGLIVIWATKAVAPALKLPLSVGLLYVPIGSVRNLRLAVLKGLDQVTWSLLPEWLLAPLLLITLVGLGNYLLTDSMTALPVIGIHLAVTVITLVIGVEILRRSLPPPVIQATPQYLGSAWISSALPMVVLGGLQIIHARIDLLMLGAMRPVSEVATYNAVLQGTQLVSIILLSANTILAPRMASLYAAGKVDQLRHLAAHSARVVASLACLVTIGLVGLGPYYLESFGPTYVAGWAALAVLSLAQLVNAATGSVGVLLNMTGHERYMVVSVGISALLNVALNALLIPRWGMNGAAIATTISLVFINLVKAWWVQQTMGINATCFGSLEKSL